MHFFDNQFLTYNSLAGLTLSKPTWRVLPSPRGTMNPVSAKRTWFSSADSKPGLHLHVVEILVDIHVGDTWQGGTCIDCYPLFNPSLPPVLIDRDIPQAKGMTSLSILALMASPSYRWHIRVVQLVKTKSSSSKDKQSETDFSIISKSAHVQMYACLTPRRFRLSFHSSCSRWHARLQQRQKISLERGFGEQIEWRSRVNMQFMRSS